MSVSLATNRVSSMRAGRALGGLVWSCCCLFLAQPALAVDEVTVWLGKMVQAAHELNYTGTFVYQQGEALQSMHIVHAVDEEGEHERLVSLSGPASEVIRERDKVTCILPEADSLVVKHAGQPRTFPLIPPEELDNLRRFYDMRLLGSERIAGKSARQITIVPRDQYRYGQNIWLAEENGLLLKTQVVNEKGQMVEQVMFTSLELRDEIPASMLAPQTKNPAKVVELIPQEETRSTAVENSRSSWVVTDLPAGFNQKMTRLHSLPKKHQPVEHHLFSDGLASVSVFIEHDNKDGKSFIGSSRLGGVNAYSRQLGEHLATVVGEVPPVTVKRIAESIQPAGVDQ